MKKKLFALVLLMFISFILPKNIFAKTLDVYLPSNYITMENLFQNMTFKQYAVYEHFFRSDNSIFDSETGIIHIDQQNNLARYYLTPGTSENDLIFDITPELRNNFIDLDKIDLFYGYDKIRFSLKTFNIIENYDSVIDFSKYDDFFDINLYDYYIFINIFDMMDFYFDTHERPFNGSYFEVNGNPGVEIISKDGKSLVKLYVDEVSNIFKVEIQDGVTYKDNITYEFSDELKDELSSHGFNCNSFSLIVGHEPSQENESKPVSNIVKNLIKNPETSNDTLIILVVCICAVSGGLLVKRIKNT